METLKTFMEKEIKLKKEHEIGTNKIENFLNSKEIKNILYFAYESNRKIKLKARNKFRTIELNSFIRDETLGYQIYAKFLGFEIFRGIFYLNYLNENIHLHTLRIVEEVYSYDLLLKDLKKVIGFEGEKDGK